MLAKQTDRVKFEVIGKTTMGNDYALLRISSPQNLAKFDRLVEINRRLADPRGLSDAEAQTLAAEGKPFYLRLRHHPFHRGLQRPGDPHIVHRLATESSPLIKEILDNAVILMVPSQNPDGQHLVIDHWYKTKGTKNARVYPDLYHKYVGHDDNRDWFMFTQKETRMNIELVQNKYKPIISHDMHQQGPTGSRIFVPPFTDPFDPNIHPLLALGQATVGQAMASALIAERQGRRGVARGLRHVVAGAAVHGLPRPAAHPHRDRQQRRQPRRSVRQPAAGHARSARRSRAGTSRCRTRRTRGRSAQQVDYGVTAALAGMSHVAKYGHEWLYNFYRVHRDWVNYDKGPFAFIVPATQRDQFATYEMLEILRVRRRRDPSRHAPFAANGKQYPAGSYVIKTAQPYGAFAKTMLEKQVYPDLRIFPGGPPEPPYDVTGHTLWMLMGVTVDQVDKPFDAPLERVKAVKPITAPAPARAEGRVSRRAGVLRRVQAGGRAAEGQRAHVSSGCRLRRPPGRHVHHSRPPRPRSPSSRRPPASCGLVVTRRGSDAGGRWLPLEAGHEGRSVDAPPATCPAAG